jgi:large subunit ribosomal protein L32
MGLPGHRRTSGDKRRRLTHIALTEGAMTKCPKCQKPVLPHRACGFCGTYRGRQVLNVDKKLSKKTK